MSPNPGSPSCCNESQAHETGADGKEIGGLFQCWDIKKMGELLSSKTYLNIFVQTEVFTRLERKSRTKGPWGGTVDMPSLPRVEGGGAEGECEHAPSLEKEEARG